MIRPELSRLAVFVSVLVSSCAANPGTDTESVADEALSSSDQTLSARMVKSSDWGSGYCMDVYLKNTGNSAVHDWALGLNLGNSTIYTEWWATYQPKSGNVKATPKGNATIEARREIGFGFCAKGSSRATITSVSNGSSPGGGGGGGGGTGGPAGYSACATEGQRCSFSGTRKVAFGAEGKFNYKTLTGGSDCTNDVFGDPIVGVVKGCYVGSLLSPAAHIVNTGWRFDIRGPGSDSQYYWKVGGTEHFKTDDPSGYGAIERSEKASEYGWGNDNRWHGFSAHYKVKRGGGSIAQVMNCEPSLGCYPQLMVVYSNGNLIQAHHTNGGVIVDGIGNEFDLKMRDNGNRNEVYVNGVLRRQGPHERTTGNNNFKYGLYHGKGQYMNLASGGEVEVSNVVVSEE